ncbi:UNVERIFIED_ORG: hypothetical protein GGD59_000488 [Rhizobium esperanzae]
MYSIRKFASERGLANLTCADQRDHGCARQGPFKSSLNGGSGYNHYRKS